MLDRINSIEKLIDISIPSLINIIDEDKKPKPAPFFNITEHFCELEKGLFAVAFLSALVERRIITPSKNIQDPPRPAHVPQIKAICKEHRQLRRCLRIFRTEISIRQEILQHASNNGWYQSAFFPRATET
jgi:hypothetical protein